MKTVFSNGQEVCHVWANLTPEEIKQGREGRCKGSVRFMGPRLYSFATVIARHVSGTRGRRGVVLDNYSFSSTTGKMQRWARRAIGYQHENLFEVNCGRRGQSLDLTGKEVFALFVDSANELIRKAHAPRIRAATRAAFLQIALSQIRNANRANEFFGLRKKPVSEDIASLSAEVKEQIENEKRKEEQKAQALASAVLKFAPQFVAMWRNRQNGTEEWRQLAVEAKRYGMHSVSFNLPDSDGFRGNAILRLSEDGSRVETSQGAQVLVRTVSFLWAFCAKARATQTAVARETLERFPRLDHYKADEIDSKGNLSAGCHKIPFAEIQAIAQALNLPPFNESQALNCSPSIPETVTA